MKAMKWIGALAMATAATIPASPAAAVWCISPANGATSDILDVTQGQGAYVDCIGNINGVVTHATATAARSQLNTKALSVTLVQGRAAQAYGYNSNRTFITGCIADTLGNRNVTCSQVVSFIMLYADKF